MKFLIALLLHLLLPSSVQVTFAKTYPPYCSIRTEQIKRSIPKLKTNTPLTNHFQSLTLQHVTTIIRHGARTPYAPHQCWTGYDDPDADTSTWECTLTTLTRPQSENAIALETLVNGNTYQSTSESGQGLFFDYEKIYDANWSKKHPNHYPMNMANDLRGNCQKGQLILKGHAQQVINGKIIKNAYVLDDELGVELPDVGILFDFNAEQNITIVHQRAYDEPRLYFRSDDDQRTIMSGQFLLGEVFSDLMVKHEEHYQLEGKEEDRPVIRVHTADRDKDVLAPNYNTCPRLTELEEEARGSTGFQERFVESFEALTMKRLAIEEFGGIDRMTNPGEAVDCVMTTLCEDKTLPYVLDVDKSSGDQALIDQYGQDIFDRYINFVSTMLMMLFQLFYS